MFFLRSNKNLLISCIFVAAKGITPSTPSDYTPITKSTVTYIVLAILVNDNDEFLMMQEAKSSCAGQWYLPAGRIEPGENILVRNFHASVRVVLL